MFEDKSGISEYNILEVRKDNYDTILLVLHVNPKAPTRQVAVNMVPEYACDLGCNEGVYVGAVDDECGTRYYCFLFDEMKESRNGLNEDEFIQ